MTARTRRYGIFVPTQSYGTFSAISVNFCVDYSQIQMSIKILSVVWQGFPLGGSELLAMLALADWSDDTGRCWPSMASIAKKTRLSRSQAQRVVHRLINDRFVAVTGNAAGGAPGSTRQYQINVSMLTGHMDATGSTHATGRTYAQEGSHSCAETGRTDATQTIIEPSITIISVEQAQPALVGKSQKAGKTTFGKFIESCKAKGEKLIPDDDPVLEYAETVGIDDEMLAIAWVEFKSYWLVGDGSAKRRVDWRRTFLNAVKQNRARLWFIREGEPAVWTTVGEQARRASA